MKEAFEKIRKPLQEEIAWYETHGCDKTLKRGIVGAMQKALRIVSEVEEEYGNGWIPCSERLPEAYTRVLCLHDDDGIDCGMLAEKTWYCDMDDFKGKKEDVIAWMPLPEPYKPEKGE